MGSYLETFCIRLSIDFENILGLRQLRHLWNPAAHSSLAGRHLVWREPYIECVSSVNSFSGGFWLQLLFGYGKI